MVERVTLFPTCLGEVMDPAVVDHARIALQACGMEVRDPVGATCCGQPAFNTGFTAQARRVARRTLRVLADGDGPIVVPSGSCASMMRLHWPQLFADGRDAATARRVAGRVQELSQVLAGRAERLRGIGLHWEGRVGYHDSCHMLRELRLAAEPRAVLACVEGLELVPMASGDRCCGFGGLFSVRYPEVSVAMADDKLVEVRQHGVDALVSCDPGCLMQLGGRVARTGGTPRVLHLATLLAEAGVGA